MAFTLAGSLKIPYVVSKCPKNGTFGRMNFDFSRFIVMFADLMRSSTRSRCSKWEGTSGVYIRRLSM